MRRLALVLVLGWLAVSPAGAFVIERFRDSSNGKWYPVRWKPGTQAIHFRLNDTPLQLLPNLASDSAILPAVQAAMQAWSFSPVRLQLDGTTSTTSWAADGVNLITLANTPANRDVTSGFSDDTLRWWQRPNNQSYWRITEVDIVLNPTKQFATDGRADMYDLRSVLTFDLGHALGLSNSPVASSVMWDHEYPGETRGRVVDPDDMNAVYAIYGDPNDAQTGSITGQVVTGAGTPVTGAGAPVFGADVVATDSDGVVRGSAFTERDGSFDLSFLPPDSYTVFVEPINPVHSGGAFSYGYYASARRSFRSTFVGGRQPQSILVSAGDTVVLDPIHVDTQTPQLSIRDLDESVNGTDYSNTHPRAIPIAAGSSTHLELVGKGLSRDTQIQASGPDVTFDTDRLDVAADGAYTRLSVPISVSAHAKPGGRNLYIFQGDEVAAFIGGVKITTGP